MEHYFKLRDPTIFTRNNKATINDVFNHFIDQVKAEIEAWSQRGSGWVVEGILTAFVNAVNAARYEPFQWWVLRAALYPPPQGVKVTTTSYPTEGGLNFRSIDFPTPVSQINKLEKQNLNLAINVFGWEKDHVIVQR